jgi:hypothetical protein
MKLTVSILMLFCVAMAGCTSQPTSPSATTGALSATDGVAPGSTPASLGAVRTAAGGRAASSGVVYVRSQGLYFDTFVARDPLPMKGQFQLLEEGTTEFGPGDPGYLGGRWWEDLNDNGVQDEGDHFFLCPLLPPGRPTP